jgi:hypothetical protein
MVAIVFLSSAMWKNGLSAMELSMSEHDSADLAKNMERDPLGRFLPGNGGRKRGSKNKLPRHVLAQVQAMGDQAVAQLWHAVLRGEPWAIQAVLAKILPADRMVAFENFSVEDLKDAITEGDISPSEGKVLAAVLRDIAEVESLDEIRARLQELEEHVREGNE